MTLPLFIHKNNRVLMAMFCGVSFFFGYSIPNHHHLYPPQLLHLTALDRAIPLMPWTILIYTSEYWLFISAYFMRMQVADWVQLPAPKLLWFNTGALILSSVALQYAQVAARRGRMEDVGDGLIVGGLFAVTFLLGQLFAWRQLNAAGYFLAANPGNAFFYLFTGVHGLHLLGGLVALGRTANKVWRGFDLNQVRLSVRLCALYWHFLLALWLVLFSLLTPWIGDFAVICRGLLI